jgi:integrase
VLTIAQVLELAGLMPDRYRVLVLLATFGCLRWGEITALQRQDLDLNTMTVRVRQQFTEVRGVGLVLGRPRSRAGVRSVTLPSAIGPELIYHRATNVGDGVDAWVFTVRSGKPIWRGRFNPIVVRSKAAAVVGVPGLHVHDLRHTGNRLASQTGTSLKDLMARMGHDSPRAALIYQHRTSEADQAIVRAVNERLEEELRAVGRERADRVDGHPGSTA